MSQKHPRPVPTTNVARRVLAGGMVGVVLVGATVVIVRWLRDDSSPATVSAGPPPSTAPPAALVGTYDVTLTVTSAEYGATWPASSPQLTPGQKVPQHWRVQ